MKWTVSCLQFDISYGNPSENFKKAESLIEQESRHADVIVLPELWTTGYDLTRLDQLADENGKVSEQWLKETAKTYNVHLVAGSFAVKEGENVYNTMYIADNSGQIVKRYQKAHLFQLMDEHLYLAAGNSDGSFELDGVKCAGLICYDIRFPNGSESIRPRARMSCLSLRNGLCPALIIGEACLSPEQLKTNVLSQPLTARGPIPIMNLPATA